jgi:hypothetical protein
MTRHTALGAVTLGALVLLAAPTAAQEETLTVTGSVEGALAQGQSASFRVTGTHHGGFRALRTLTIALELHGAELDAITFNVDDGSISAGSGDALLGTGDSTNGRFFSVRALDVAQSTSGNRIDVSFAARVLEAVPEGTRFVFTAEDDAGEEASISRTATVPGQDEGGFPFATLIIAVAGALVAGGYFGSRLTAHRRRGSIYETVAKKIEEERRGRARSSKASGT